MNTPETYMQMSGIKGGKQGEKNGEELSLPGMFPWISDFGCVRGAWIS